MSDEEPDAIDNPADDQNEDPPEQADEQAEPDSETDDKPELEDDEIADLGPVAEELEEASQQEGDGEDEGEDSDEEDSTDPTEREIDPSQTDISLGTVYTNALGMSAAVARGRYGDLEDGERERIADEYAEMARQIDLDTYLDQWMREQGGLDELSPGEAVLLGTLMWGGMVMLDDPTMAENALSGVAA